MAIGSRKRNRLYQKYKGRCFYCGKENLIKVRGPYPPKPEITKVATIDHIVPRVFGGSDADENLVLACYSCNLSKGSKIMLDSGIYQPNLFWP